jgi:nucleoside-diphosphate kinase
VYKGVIPDFADHVAQLAMGLCVALEVRAENAVRTFRETAGPWDVEMAKVSCPVRCAVVDVRCGAV